MDISPCMPSHTSYGRAKAAFFAKYGFKVEQWEVLAASLENMV